MHPLVEQCWELTKGGKTIYHLDAEYRASQVPGGSSSTAAKQEKQSSLSTPRPVPSDSEKKGRQLDERLRRALDKERAEKEASRTGRSTSQFPQVCLVVAQGGEHQLNLGTGPDHSEDGESLETSAGYLFGCSASGWSYLRSSSPSEQWCFAWTSWWVTANLEPFWQPPYTLASPTSRQR